MLADSTAEDRAGVEAAVLDYVEGVYDADPDRIRRSVHPDLAKFGFARRSTNDDYRIIPMTFDQLVELAGEYNADGTKVPAGAPKTIEILDVLDQTAAAKLTASWGVDYFHLAKYDGRWQIVQVLWQSVSGD
jgi:hypothetical protein